MIRKAIISDIKTIYKLLQEYGKQGELLPQPLSRLYDHIRDFTVFADPEAGKILGCCALQICWEDLAEIRSLVVHPDHVNRGIGTRLIQEAVNEAFQYKIKKLFLLTYRPGYFERFGFTTIEKEALPPKIWADCITCVKFPDCDETAMIRTLE